MKLTEYFLEELATEEPGTRRTLERVPENRADWRPHPKSMPLGYLSTLVATMPSWIDLMVRRDQIDVTEFGDAQAGEKNLCTTRDLLRAFDESMAAARAALAATTDEHLMTGWRLFLGDRKLSEQPRYVMIRDGMLNHWAHHRGQLTVYLRLNDAPVPALYGPSADEF